MNKNTNAVFLSLALLVSASAMAMETQQEDTAPEAQSFNAKTAMFEAYAKTTAYAQAQAQAARNFDYKGAASNAYTAAQTRVNEACTAARDFDYAGKANDAAKFTKGYVKAHPYKTAGMTALTAATVAAIYKAYEYYKTPAKAVVEAPVALVVTPVVKSTPVRTRKAATVKAQPKQTKSVKVGCGKKGCRNCGKLNVTTK